MQYHKAYFSLYSYFKARMKCETLTRTFNESFYRTLTKQREEAFDSLKQALTGCVQSCDPF